MNKQLERRARGGSLLSSFELFQLTSDHNENSDEWFKRCRDYLQNGAVDTFGVFRPENSLYLRSLSLVDFRRFSLLDVMFEDDLTVIIGNNGQGKSSILSAIAKTLSWFSANILKEEGVGQRLSETTDIRNESVQKYTDVSSNFYFGKGLKNISVRLSRAVSGNSTRRDGLVKEIKEIADVLRVVNDKQAINLPVFAFYSVERSHPFNRLIKDSNEQREERLDAYTNALSGAGRFDHFIEWFIALHKRTAGDFTNGIETIRQQVRDLKLSVENGLVSVKPLLDEAELKLADAISKESKLVKTGTLPEALQKKLIVKAISTVVPSISNIWVDTSSGSDVVKVISDNNEVTIEQLSDGQRVFLGLVADLARRMVMLNPLLENPFEGRGIILIDEIELHLHPKWQQDVIANLQDVFPNLQKIITTHSPIVLSTVDKRCVRQFIEYEEEAVVYLEPPKFQTKGVINSDILELVMRVFAAPPHIAESHWVDELETALDDKEYDDNPLAKDLYEKIKKHFGEDSSELKKCEALIRLQAMKRKALAKWHERNQPQ
ncbi:MAG: uncharacterized protein H6R25_2806 [Proteobacteria bacterium]|nr:uncharacterized protein [Pseudomonadota bacterium]